MIFESVNYSHLLQDFVFSMGAGFAAAMLSECLSVLLPSGRKSRFLKDVLMCFLFAVVIFSYVVSFTNYPIIRTYHLAGGVAGFLSFPFEFFTLPQKIFKNFFVKLKNKMLWLFEKLRATVCAEWQKRRKKTQEQQKAEQNGDLKTEEVWVYNL